MVKKILRRLLIVGTAIFLVAGSVSFALGDPKKPKPPWHPHGDDPPPVSAPEPTTLSLIGLGLAGVAGYRIVRRKRKKQGRGHAPSIRKDDIPSM